MDPRRELERFLLGESGTSDLQLWIYGDDALRGFFGDDLSDDLLSLNYARSTARVELERLLLVFFEERWPSRLNKLKLIRVCDDLISNRTSLISAGQALAFARCDDSRVPAVFAAVDVAAESEDEASVRSRFLTEAIEQAALLRSLLSAEVKADDPVPTLRAER